MTDEQPLVSIVTPSYDQGQFLEETILSVLDQDYPKLEYIIIDGGSTDGSVDIIRKYEDRLAYWVSEPDEGMSDGINKGWRQARGDILAWLNSDDTYVPGAVSIVVEFLNAHPEVDMVYGYVHITDRDGHTTQNIEPSTEFDLHRFIYSYFYLPQQTVFLRRHVLDKVGMLDTSLQYCMDPDLWSRIGMHFNVRGTPAYIANFRIHGTGKSHTPSLEWVQERYLVAKRYGGADNARPAALVLMYRWAQLLARDFGADHRALLERDWVDLPGELSTVFHSSRSFIASEAYMEAAWAHGLAGRLSYAVRCAWNAVREDPLVLIRDRGILPTIFRGSRRFLSACRRRLTQA